VGETTNDDIKESFTFNVERYVFDDNSGGYNLVIRVWGRG
jgi:hypothetical protein